MKVEVIKIDYSNTEKILQELSDYPFLEVTEVMYFRGKEVSENIEGMNYGHLWETFKIGENVEMSMVKDALLALAEDFLFVHQGLTCMIDTTDDLRKVYQINALTEQTGHRVFLIGSKVPLDDSEENEYKEL